MQLYKNKRAKYPWKVVDQQLFFCMVGEEQCHGSTPPEWHDNALKIFDHSYTIEVWECLVPPWCPGHPPRLFNANHEFTLFLAAVVRRLSPPAQAEVPAGHRLWQLLFLTGALVGRGHSWVKALCSWREVNAHILSGHPSIQAWIWTKGLSVFLGKAVLFCVKCLNSCCERDWNFALKLSPLVTYLLTPSPPLALPMNKYSMKVSMEGVLWIGSLWIYISSNSVWLSVRAVPLSAWFLTVFGNHKM